MKNRMKVLTLLVIVTLLIQLGGVAVYGAEVITTDDIRLFAESTSTASSTYFGKLYEPVSGIYFGASYVEDNTIEPSNDKSNYEYDAVRSNYRKKNSAYLMHLEFGTPIDEIKQALEDADDANVAVVLVWEVSQTYSSMTSYNDYIQDTAEYLRWLDVPVFLSYGAGANSEKEITSGTQFAANYKYVADIVRDRASDIALVWTMDASNNSNIDSFYPGDIYVDWVGINAFIEPGEDVVTSIEGIIERYGNDKPVMLTEAGVARYSKINGNVDSWGESQLRKLYSYVPMIYPQIKGIFYLNGIYDGNQLYLYDLYGNDDMVEAYNDLVSSDMYLTDIKQSGNYRYAEVNGRKDPSVYSPENSVEISTMLEGENLEGLKVDYLIDGRSYFSTTELPYRYNLQLKGMSDEKHALNIRVYDGTTLLADKKYTVIGKEDGGLIESGDYKVIDFEDIRGKWSEPYIIEVSKRGIVVGSNNIFRPDDYISRAEMTSVISKLGKLSQIEPVNFKDVPTWQWYHKYVSGAQEYLKGYGNYYYPSQYASREEIITALVKLKGYNVSDLTTKDRDDFAKDFNDEYMISAENVDYMILAVKYDIIDGYEDKTLRPTYNMKRGELAKVIYTTFYQ